MSKHEHNTIYVNFNTIYLIKPIKHFNFNTDNFLLNLCYEFIGHKKLLEQSQGHLSRKDAYMIMITCYDSNSAM